MQVQEYVYRMKPVIIPGAGYLLVYPLLTGILSFLLNLPEVYVKIFSAIYAVTALMILFIWLTAKSKKIIIDDNIIIFQSLLGKQVLEPKDIRKASFYWTAKSEEIVQLKVGKKTFYLSNLYFPFNELLTDLEQFIIANNIRSNLASHYGMN
ncbi:MAG: hypothetical protein ACOX3R_05960 [Desulfitobacteriia bacterium]|jgi:hypothetical protein